MQCKSTWAILAGVGMFLSGVAGCGQPAYQVKGKVMFDGKPMVGGGSITFIPIGKQRMAGGEIAPDGSYSLSSVKPGDGAMVGDYKVAITQVTNKEPEPTPDGQKPKAASPGLPPADRIPSIYADHVQTPLTAKVEAKSSHEINFDLKRQ
jgi:hypothetical protein